MDAKEYKDKKFDKLTRDVVKMVNSVPTFGYGPVVDAVLKNALTNHLLTLVRINELREDDIEILSQSALDELVALSMQLVGKIKTYEADLESLEK